MKPSEMLDGRILEGGYEVRKRLPENPDHTGGNFSVCYLVHKAGRDYFLKATDVTFYRGGGDQATRIRDSMTVYIYERDLLELARAHAMTRVVRVLAAGDVPVKIGDPKSGEFEIAVFYLIFEQANVTLRDKMMDTIPRRDDRQAEGIASNRTRLATTAWPRDCPSGFETFECRGIRAGNRQ